MKRVNVPQSLEKGHALDAIFYTLTNFAELLYNVDTQPELTAGSELSKVSQLVSDEGYQEALENIDWTIFGNLSTEGFEEFLLKCKALSDAYDLGINIPVDVKVVGQEIVDEFYKDLKQKALETILENKSQAQVFKQQLTEQASKIDFEDDEDTYLESILTARQKYNEAKDEFDKAQSEIVALASSHEFTGYDPLYAILNASKDKMDMLLKENPLIIFFKGKTDSEVVLKEIISLTNKIEKSLDKLNKKISEDTYPLWELTPLVSFVLNQDKYQNHRELILYDIEKKKSDKYKKELFITIGTIVLATATLLIPGGCCFGLLLAKALTAAAGTALSIAQSTKDFIEAGELKDLAYANVLTTDQLKLVDDADVTKATRDYILSGAFVFLGIFDIADSTKTVMLIRKFDKLDDVTRLALKGSKRFGAKAFQNCDADSLKKIGTSLPESHATEIFNMKNTVNVVDSLGTKANPKVFTNLSSLEAPKVPVALDFFPNNLNTNIIWLGMDNVDAETVLTCSKSVCAKYNKVADEINTVLDFSKKPAELEKEVNNIAVSLIRNKKLNLSPSEHVTLLKESLPPAEKLTARKLYLRVQANNDWKTLASPNKSFAWMTDPLMIAGDGLPRDLTNSVGFLKKDVDSLSDCCYFDLVVFKDAKTAEKYIPNKITGWDRISEDFFNGMDEEIAKITDPIELEKYKDRFPNLVTDKNTFDRDYFNKHYLEYFSKEHVPGTEYESGLLSKLGKKIEEKTGANKLYQGAGITVQESGGIRSIERAFDKSIGGTDYNFNIDRLQATGEMKIYRFEITSDTSKPIKILEPGAKK